MKVVAFRLYPVAYPTKGFFKFFHTPLGRPGRPTVVVQAIADDGTAGWGQAVPVSTWSDETLETAILALGNYYFPTLIGCDPRDLTAAHAALDQAIRPGFTTGMPIARAALDLALHDLIGQASGQSLAQLWGQPGRGTLELSWTVNVTTLDHVEPTVAAGQQQGYRHFNIKIAPNPAFDLAVVQRVRRAAPAAFLWVDANAGFDLTTALALAPKLADLGVRIFESPLPPNRLRDYQTLKRQGAVPVFLDEGVISPVELEEFIHLNMMDGISMKPARCGGLTSCRRQIELCRQHGLPWAGSGLCDPDLSLAASLALFDACGLTTPAALNGPQFLDASILQSPIPIDQAQAHVPTGPGLGVTVNPAALAELSAKTIRDWHLHQAIAALPDPLPT